MTPFTQHTGKVARLDRDNIDTDAIIPKQFMKSIARTGFGPYLFDEWRYQDEGYYGKPVSERVPNPEFVLNDARFADASILLSGRNFGCGSSREHAPWALYQFGFRVLIASSFADIFFNNCCKNGLLPVVLREEEIAYLRNGVDTASRQEMQPDPTLEHGSRDDLASYFRLTVNLIDGTVKVADGTCFSFDMTPGLRQGLLDGVDEVGATLLHAEDIRAFERTRMASRPWL
jgi:3-isopropylmalate/(R)-2-methylmalate dehydratase small subunit